MMCAHAMAQDKPALPKVSAVRFGGDATATRLVLDTDAALSARLLSTSGGPRQIVLALPRLEAPVGFSGNGQGLVKGWKLESADGGARLTVSLNADATVRKRFVIPPSAGVTGYRYVIDFIPAPAVAASSTPAPTSISATASGPTPAVETASFSSATPLVSTKAKTAAKIAKSSRTAAAAVSSTPAPISTSDPSPTPALQTVSFSTEPALAVATTTKTAKTTKNSKMTAPVHPTPVAADASGARQNRKVVVIDAGHGGHDPGAQGTMGGATANEKDITLATALALRARLEKTGRYKVVLTRATDVFIPLETRVQIARRAGADLFIALHADSAGGDASPHGASVYTLSDHGETRVNQVLGSHEWFDKAGGRNDPGVGRILLDLTQRETLNRSAVFAQILLDQLADKIDLLPRSHRDAGYFVLLAPDVPAVLLEMGFITSPLDQARLTDPIRRAELTGAIAAAIDAYFTGQTHLAER